MEGPSMRIFAPVMVLAAALASGSARAQEAAAPARAHFDRGAALAAEHKYAEAALAFKAAYESEPGKEALFAWAQSERLAGHCAAAVSLYRSFLAQPDLTAPQREAAELNLGRCESAPDTTEPAAVEPAPPAVAPPQSAPPVLTAPVAAPPPVELVQPRRSRRAVWVGAGLLAASAAALAGSTTFFLLARGDDDQAASAFVFDDYYRARGRARDRQRIAAAALGGGVLLAGAALLQWMYTQPKPRLTAWVGPDAAGLGGRF
jgi:hypothetical protein